MALNEFEGTVMLVSHDRALLREVCDEFWLVSAGKLQPFDGDLDDYQRWLLEQARAAARAARPQAEPPTAVPRTAAPSAARSDAQPRNDRKAAAAARQQRADAARPLKKELNLVDNRLGVLFAERDALETAAGSDTLDEAQRAESGRRLKEIGTQIETLEGRWLELSTKLDEIAESVG
jgi:ATP-binding cassette subfamily F protein 3